MTDMQSFWQAVAKYQQAHRDRLRDENNELWALSIKLVGDVLNKLEADGSGHHEVRRSAEECASQMLVLLQKP